MEHNYRLSALTHTISINCFLRVKNISFYYTYENWKYNAEKIQEFWNKQEF